MENKVLKNNFMKNEEEEQQTEKNKKRDISGKVRIFKYIY